MPSLKGLALGLRDTVRSIPGVPLVEAQADAGGRFIRRQIQGRPNPPRAEVPAGPTAAARPAVMTDRRPSILQQKMGALLTASTRNTPAESRRALYEALIGELVPDEARILSALSDGSAYALVHIAEAGIGGPHRRVLENASSVGRAAGVALPEHVPLYVSHLRHIGLVESGKEDHSLRDEYDILLTDPKLRAMIAATGRGPMGARIVRRTLRMSGLGRELWDAANPPQEVDGDTGDSPTS